MRDLGVLIDWGIRNYQIFQRNEKGIAQFSFGGEYVPVPDQQQFVLWRAVYENTGEYITKWSEAKLLPDNKWQADAQLPQGGLYRIETCLHVPQMQPAVEWSTRGDMVHHIGVGDLYVIAGQSNSAGYGKDFINDPPQLGLHLYDNSGNWVIATHPLNESTNTIHPVNREGGNPGHSPYLSFSRMLKDRLNIPIGLIQTSLGGSSLAMWDINEQGMLYTNMLDCIKACGGKITGVLWYQGCSDAGFPLCDTYKDRFLNVVAQLDKDLNQKVYWLTVQLNRIVSQTEGQDNNAWGVLRMQQHMASLEHDRVFIAPNNDCAYMSDAIHNGAAGNVILGERLARLALNHIYDIGPSFDAPYVEKATIQADNQITLHFQNVQMRMDTFGVITEDLVFEVNDSQGVNKITAYAIPEYNQITLTLERLISGQAVVHGAYKVDIGGFVPVDIGTHLPMLSFYGIEVR